MLIIVFIKIYYYFLFKINFYILKFFYYIFLKKYFKRQILAPRFQIQGWPHETKQM